jgi:transmembrane sensor
MIDLAAAEWAARVDRGPLSTEDEAALHAWLDGDVRRPGAYARVRAMALYTERASALGASFRLPAPAGAISRRRLVFWGGAIAASAGAVGALGWELLAGRQEFYTRKGETRVVALADGSVVTLNTDSRVSVRLTHERRDVRLLTGEALFDVAKNPSRPFIVAAGTSEIRAVGTSFAVRRLMNAPVQVLVREGVVDVTTSDDGYLSRRRVDANSRAVAAAQGTPLRVMPVAGTELQRELAWRNGQLMFDGETLRVAAAEFARYSDIRIVVDDPALGEEEIAGLFQANDPVGFARAVAVSLRAHATIGQGEVRLAR